MELCRFETMRYFIYLLIKNKAILDRIKKGYSFKLENLNINIHLHINIVSKQASLRYRYPRRNEFTSGLIILCTEIKVFSTLIT